MDAVEFLKQKTRLCDTSDCVDCPLSRCNNGKSDCDCSNFILVFPKETVAKVEKWATEHPPKTRQIELLKLFPMTRMIDGVIDICPIAFVTKPDGSRECLMTDDLPISQNCKQCKRQFWLTEIK
jgi:hypothetical protein